MRRPILSLTLLILSLTPALGMATANNLIAWEPWSDAVFERAKKENKFVILDMEAVWCHWCHVMDEKTYANPDVAKLMGERYIAVKVDQDSNPDLSRRYENYGWPATIVFDGTGQEIVKRRGYLPPERMISMLKAIIDDPSPILYSDSKPVTEFADKPLLEDKLRMVLQKRFTETSDQKIGGLVQAQKFLDRDLVEYAMLRGAQGDKQALKIARVNLDNATRIIDPVWGGAYQYSTDGDWAHPHFEKIMEIQAGYLRMYAQAYARYHDPAYLKAALDIQRYIRDFLTSPDGAFYTSQDADLVKGQHGGEYFSLSDKERRKLGMPAIDKHIYARENGWMIYALTLLYSATGDQTHLDAALKATDWVVKHRGLAGGGFSHGETDKGGPYLDDTLAMARAFLSLYTVTADKQWLGRAEQAAAFIETHFKASAGYLTSEYKGGILKPQHNVDENIAMARFANLLVYHTGQQDYRKTADHAMRYLVTEDVALFRRTEAGILIADIELKSEPPHITIVGHKDDPEAQALFQSALAYPGIYRRVEWWDKREGELPNPDVQYPQLSRAAAFACSNNTCSLPVFKTTEIAAMVNRLNLQ